MTRFTLPRSALAVAAMLVALPAFAAGSINSTNNSMPNRISMNCMTAKGKPVTNASACAAPASTNALPAPAGRATKTRSNIQNN